MNKIKLSIIALILFSCDNSKKNEENQARDIQNTVDSLNNSANYKASALNDYHSAINLYEEALAIDSENFEALGNQALILNQVGNFSKAISKFTKVIDLIENGKGSGRGSKEAEASMYYSERGKAKLQLNDLQGALSDFTYSIENGNGGYDDYIYRGTVYLRLSRKNEACSDFSKAGEQGNAEAYDYINQYCQ